MNWLYEHGSHELKIELKEIEIMSLLVIIVLILCKHFEIFKNNETFFIKNESFFIKNDTFCIKNETFLIKNRKLLILN